MLLGNYNVHPGLTPLGMLWSSRDWVPWRWAQFPPLCLTKATLNKWLTKLNIFTLPDNFHLYNRQATSRMEDGLAICDLIFSIKHPLKLGVTWRCYGVSLFADPPAEGKEVLWSGADINVGRSSSFHQIQGCPSEVSPWLQMRAKIG